MEKENEIKNDDFDNKQEGSPQENGTNGGDDTKGSTQEYGANDGKENEVGKVEKQEGSTARSLSRTEIREDNGANSGGLEKIQIKRMTPKKIIKCIILLIIFIIAWFAVVQYIAADKYEAVVKVMEEGGKIGVNPMTDRLDYGDLPKGNTSTRFVTIENGGKMNVYVVIFKYGEIAELIRINRNNFIIESGEKEKVEFSLEMPISANKEGYEGKVLIFKLPKVF